MDSWQQTADGEYVGSTPSRRFPVYTRGNVGEVFPEVVFPLSFTASWERTVTAWHRALLTSGVVNAADLEGESAAASGVFGGYTYLNVSMLRLVATRTPAMTVSKIDHDYLGTTEQVAHTPTAADRNLRASVSVLWYISKVLRARDLPVQSADLERVRTWRASLPDPSSATDAELVALLDPSTEFIGELFEHHVIVSGAAPAALTMLSKLLKKHLGDETAVNELITGIGEVASAAPTLALWDLSRIVAESPKLTEAFDLGLGNLGERLAAEPSTAVFRHQLASVSELRSSSAAEDASGRSQPASQRLTAKTSGSSRGMRSMTTCARPTRSPTTLHDEGPCGPTCRIGSHPSSSRRNSHHRTPGRP